MNTTLEPISIKNTDANLPISLRGSLAHEYYELLLRGESKSVQDYLSVLLTSTDPNIIRYKEGFNLVIGLRSEKGQFFPDW